MNIKFEKRYCFKVAGVNLEQIHIDVSNLLRILPDSIYDNLLLTSLPVHLDHFLNMLPRAFRMHFNFKYYFPLEALNQKIHNPLT